MRRHHPGRAADAARGVDAEHRLADRAERIGEVELGHHHALEHVRRLADHHRVDVRPGHPGVVEGPFRRLPDETRDRDVLPLGGVLGLPDPDDRDPVHAASPSRTATRFCCRHGPLVACATTRRTRRSATAPAAAARRSSPPTIIGPAAVSTGCRCSPNASRKSSSWCGYSTCSQAASTSSAPGVLGSGRGRRRSGQVTTAECWRLDPVVDPADPGRRIGQLAGPVADREDHRGRTVGDVSRRDLRDVGKPAAVPHRLGLQAGQPASIRPQRRDRVRVELDRQGAIELTAGRTGEGIDQCGVDRLPPTRAVLQHLDRLGERERAVHLQVRLTDRRPGADGIESADEGERKALQVVTRAGDGEADVTLRQPDLAQSIVDDRQQHLDLVAGRLGRRLERRRRDDRHRPVEVPHRRSPCRCRSPRRARRSGGST